MKNIENDRMDKMLTLWRLNHDCSIEDMIRFFKNDVVFVIEDGMITDYMYN